MAGSVCWFPAAPVFADMGHDARCQGDIALCKVGFFDAVNAHRFIRLWPVVLQLGQAKIFDHETRRKRLLSAVSAPVRRSQKACVS